MAEQAHRNAPQNWRRDDAPQDARLLAEWTEDVLPNLRVRLFAGRYNVVLDSSGHPKQTDEWIPPGVDILTGPAALRPTTGDSNRLRSMAAMLLDAADALDDALVPGLHQLAAGDHTTTAGLF